MGVVGEPPLRPAQRAVAAPSDLLAWVAATGTQEAARVLGVDGGRIRQLRRGDCLRISPALLARWEAHKPHVPATPWQLRRVGRGGVVVLAGVRWCLPASLVPQRAQVLVALSAAGVLLVRLADGPVAVSIQPGGAA
ncbi:hypothetical protein GWK50_01915 [Acidovorax sp. 210-6]|nr:hypothetical protein [Acidovorax sp. 210-6]